MKYVGVTFGKIGILSRKIPLEAEPKIEKVKYQAPLPPKPRKVERNDLVIKEEKKEVKKKEVIKPKMKSRHKISQFQKTQRLVNK